MAVYQRLALDFHDLCLVLMHLKLGHLIFHVEQFGIIRNRDFLVIVEKLEALAHHLFHELADDKGIFSLGAPDYLVKILKHAQSSGEIDNCTNGVVAIYSTTTVFLNRNNPNRQDINDQPSPPYTAFPAHSA